MGQDTLGASKNDGFFGGLMGRILLFWILVCLFLAPVWFGTPQHPELQKTLAENAFALSSNGAGAAGLLSSAYVHLFSYSYPNRNLSLLLFAIGFMALLAVIGGLRLNSKNHNVTYAGIGFALLMLGIMASGKMCKVPEFKDSWGGALFVLYGVFFYACAICLTTRARRETAGIVICLSLIVVACSGLTQACGGLESTRELFAQKQGFPSFEAYSNSWQAVKSHTPEEIYTFSRLSSPRISATYTSPNILACHCMLVFLLALGLMKEGKRNLTRAVALLTALICLWLLVLTRSKSVIALAAGLAVCWSFLLCKAGAFSKKAFLTALICAIAYVALGLLYGYGSKLGAKLASTGNARLGYWKVALKMARQKAMTGYGINSFARWYKVWAPQGAEPAKFAHNALLQLWAEFGLFTALGWLLAFTLPFVNAYDRFVSAAKKDALQLSCIMAGVGFFLHSLMDFDFHVPGLTVTAIAILSLCYVSGDESSDSGLALK